MAMSLVELAQETLEIVKRGEYVTKTGQPVRLKAEVEAAIAGTRLYAPEELQRLLETRPTGSGSGLPEIEITPETTAEASHRLFLAGFDPLALNFASAKNPGGGFLGGAKAQEEDLARCSALYDCQLTAPEYYRANRAFGSMLYTDYMIYSPKVPFFRDANLDLLEKPFLASVVTAPAPNAGEFLKREPGGQAELHAALERRAGMLLALAAERGHRQFVLGAWGCGVFRNDPAEVAGVFAAWLRHPSFAGAFDRVVFGIYERDKNRPVLEIFKRNLVG